MNLAKVIAMPYITALHTYIHTYIRYIHIHLNSITLLISPSTFTHESMQR